jgi:hypothetical protein
MNADTLLDSITAQVQQQIDAAEIGNAGLVVKSTHFARNYAIFGKDNTKSTYSRYAVMIKLNRDTLSGTGIFTDYGASKQATSVAARQSLDFTNVGLLATAIGNFLITGSQG